MATQLDYGTATTQQNPPLQPLKCPRCDSTNTKFCYYNNYSLAQPRHFCKSCKRYWTRGGTLRNVPVGGGCRKNKKLKNPHRSAASVPLPSIIHGDYHDSLFYRLQPMNSTVLYPKLELDSRFAGYEENFQSFVSTADIVDLEKPAIASAGLFANYSIFSSQIPSSYDDLPIASENNISSKSMHWQVVRENPLEVLNSFDTGISNTTAEFSSLYWNQTMNGSWPGSGSSLAPLID